MIESAPGCRVQQWPPYPGGKYSNVRERRGDIHEDDNFVRSAIRRAGQAEFLVLGVKVGGAEAVLSVEASMRKFTDNTYTLTRRVVRATGPIEDSVIFTTVPLDLYTYRILSHPNPELVGGEVQVRMPREPITVMVDRDFYNDHIEAGSFKIDSASSTTARAIRSPTRPSRSATVCSRNTTASARTKSTSARARALSPPK